MTDKTTYLEARVSVDDQALNRRVWNKFRRALSHFDDETRPVRILESGAGIGTMIERLVARDVLPSHTRYRAIDIDEVSVAHANSQLPTWLDNLGYEVDAEDAEKRVIRAIDETAPGSADGKQVEIHLESGDFFSLAETADVVIATAFLDLFEIDSALDHIGELLREDGIFYAPLTYDGATGFWPSHPLDRQIERLYHHHMDEIRNRPGSSRAGRELIGALPAAGFDRASVGGSDWVIQPRDGSYAAEEETVLREILTTIEDALTDFSADVLAPEKRTQWCTTRRNQLESGTLGMVAHHMDVFARKK